MGRVIQGSSMSKTPSVKFTQKGKETVLGTWILGTKVGQHAWKDNIIFEFAIEDAHEKLAITLPGPVKGEYVDAEVKPGDKVSIWGTVKDGRPNQIADKLSQVQAGEKVKVTFNGCIPNPKNGHTYNDFTVEVL